MTTNFSVERCLDAMASSFKAEIDFLVMSSSLADAGWVVLDCGQERSVQNELEWVQENCRGNFHQYKSVFVFQDKSDATAFALKWL